MTRDLPPPPSRPELSPEVRVRGEEDLRIEGLPGEPSLEARIRWVSGARRAVLLCHPHPLYGGTMHSAVIVALAKVLAERAETLASVLRFNTRGVGTSQGKYGAGIGETLDVRAALRALRARAPSARISVCGYSFGTWVGLRGAAEEGGIDRVALVAPAVRIFDFVRDDAAKLRAGGASVPLALYVGDRDEFCSVEEARHLATDLHAVLEVFEGSDHFFLASRRKVADGVVPFLVPEIAARSP